MAAALGVPVLAASAWPWSAAGTDLSVSSAAVDQPRINVAFAPAATPAVPYVGEGFDINGNPVDTIQINAFWDTGASGIVLSEATADALGIALQQAGGGDVVFSDVSPGGPTPFYVSERMVMRLAPSLGYFDNEEPYFTDFGDPANFLTSYAPAGPAPLRAQVGPIGAITFFGEVNVVGMPSMVGRKVVIDPRPTDNFLTLVDADPNNDNYDAFVRAYSYDAAKRLGTPGDVNDPLLDPGVPTANVSVSLSYADFARYTDLQPPSADPPTQSYNPFLGPNPLAGPQPGDGPAPLLRRGNRQSRGSWLLDTGAAASFISRARAADLNVAYSPNPAHGLGSDDPWLVDATTLQPLPNQFQLAISGISGEVLLLAGFYADSLTVFTDQGNPANAGDPRHLRYVGAPVLVYDVTLQNPDDPDDVLTLDGIFGMNYLVASADIDVTQFPPAIDRPRATPFDAIVFDEPARKLYL